MNWCEPAAEAASKLESTTEITKKSFVISNTLYNQFYLRCEPLVEEDQNVWLNIIMCLQLVSSCRKGSMSSKISQFVRALPSDHKIWSYGWTFENPLHSWRMTLLWHCCAEEIWEKNKSNHISKLYVHFEGRCPVVARLVYHVEESEGSWRSVLRLDAPKSSPDLRLLRLARCISLTRAWTTSDIGGRNSGSGCTWLNKMFTIGNYKWRGLCNETCMRIWKLLMEIGVLHQGWEIPVHRGQLYQQSEKVILQGRFPSKQGPPFWPTHQCHGVEE